MSELIEFLGGPAFPLYICAVALLYLLLDQTSRLFEKPHPEPRRWFSNFCLYASNSAVAYLLLYWLGFRVEDAAAEIPFGLFRHFAETPFVLQLIAYALLLDFLVYWLHRGFHRFTWLWRIHLIHHSDIDLDFTDSFRFHPFERILDIPLILTTALILGVDLKVLLAYNLLYTAFVFFPHANLSVHPTIDWWIRLVIVTPDMHRIHHIAHLETTNSNYGDVFSFWDKIFGTYRHMDRDSQRDQPLGLEYFRSPRDQSFFAALMHPFSYNPEKHPASREQTPEQT